MRQVLCDGTVSDAQQHGAAAQARRWGCLVHFVRLATTLIKVEGESARHSPPLLPVTMPNIHRFLKIASLTDSAVCENLAIP